MRVRRILALIALALAAFGVGAPAQADALCARPYIGTEALEFDAICVPLP